MPLYRFEDFVNPAHKNGDGTVRYDVDTSYAANALGKALRDTKIPGTPWNWPAARVEFESIMYSWHSPVNWTVLSSVQFAATRGPATIYTTDHWRGAGRWTQDAEGYWSVYTPSPFRNGQPDSTGVTVSPSHSPVVDLTGSNGITLENISFNPQKLLGPINIRPTTIPGGALMFSSLERVQRNPLTGTLYYDGSGGQNSSNNCVLRDVSVSGYWGAAGIWFGNSVIHRMSGGGIQIYENNSPVRALACTQLPLSIGSVTPSATGDYQSPFYPDLPDPQYRSGYDADQRMMRTRVAAGAVVLDGTEIHSMIRDTFPAPGTSSLAAPILLHMVNQFEAYGGRPIGSDGLAAIEVQNFARLVRLRGIEFWNPDRRQYENNSFSSCILFLNNCRYPRTGEQGLHEPLTSLSIDDCVMTSPYTGAYIRGVGDSDIYGFHFGPTNNIRGDVPITDLSIGYSLPGSTVQLRQAMIYAKNNALRVGGSLGATTRIADAGPITVGGTDAHTPF